MITLELLIEDLAHKSFSTENTEIMAKMCGFYNHLLIEICTNNMETEKE